ncbi:hypothetical protein [Streptomyces aureus]|uniref:hypothetical protein n=1 Tax=Streptomyces aureus TaxID=193461 RepID=UPI00131D858F|nr:hypothetical protein [Streptomyces aureus]
MAAVDVSDEATFHAAAAMLGLHPKAVQTTQEPSKPSAHASLSPRRAKTPSPSTSSGGLRQAGTPLEAPRPIPLLFPMGTELAVSRQWTQPPVATEPTPNRGPTPPHPYLPLFPPRSESAILRLLLSRVVHEGPIDVQRVLTAMAHGRHVAELPRLPVRTLRFGVQVLVDINEGTRLFARDQQQLLDRITAIAGAHACDVRYFAQNPLRSGRSAGWSWKPYTAPPSGTRVLIISDFGQNTVPRAEQAENRKVWQRAAALWHRADCLPVGLAPLSARQQPAWMRLLMPLLSWDRSTTASTAHARLR